MFTGLTNQVSSWMGSVKGDQEEKVPTPTEDSNALVGSEKKEGSPTKASGGGKLEMFSNVKNQIEGIGGWLGSSIPKLRKADNEQVVDGQEQPPLSEPEPQGLDTHPLKDEDDNSSATGGADSGPQSAAESPTEDKDSQFVNVQTKALAGAKSFGSFLYSAVNKAGKTVSEASAKIKESVEKNSILGEFNREQEAFIKNQGDSISSPLPPWVGCANEEALKDECLSLSTDRRNFVRSPPAGVDFVFDYQVSYPVAMAIMEQDPNLEKMRYELVPKVISEENFWRNYFYRVSLICQANELSFMSREGDSQSATETYASDQLIDDSTKKDMHEFVSDTLQVSSEDLKEVNEGMKKLALGSKNNVEDWEKELEAELQDYEMVSEQKSTNSKSDNWEQEIDEMLQDETDLK
ncbi:synapse-associated protein of 47 kDa isoform X4 [Diorhabda carinulata]|uniref:synapse-associated protein of 47 kDa isoform X4 n=1 Tax=Diorhabda sublineata TaxID=1163346 RepID=UPI0024E043C8|nr:synapse-associated protein of 47 kDa isoform X4 [Diorhabda sublineata]XP_056645297.1 synapse-associated protein of 47 kDa isoform X4 [Diorhabda sublineata]XP_057668041.1 synapse-associated protein of 47 kDa isoform X4 [Diorhabda carinulata]XP_057668049.1 synapse-associated protein of 47 kDa isoform X4 [Diorhabda carinulata]XP_057668057.1 synapse-associated protein of 47 kDa isoform X4 [Diorhabda carinulata]